MEPVQKLQLIKTSNKYGLITGALTSAWVGFEYLTGTLFGIPQLGPLYGLISITFFIIMTILFLRKVRFIESELTYFQRFKLNLTMIFKASVVVVFFLLWYYSLMDPSQYQTYEIEVFAIHLDHVLLTSIVGAWIGTMAEGVLFGSIAAIFIKSK